MVWLGTAIRSGQIPERYIYRPDGSIHFYSGAVHSGIHCVSFSYSIRRNDALFAPKGYDTVRLYAKQFNGINLTFLC
jgi:hypothetical protein